MRGLLLRILPQLTDDFICFMFNYTSHKESCLISVQWLSVLLLILIVVI